MEYDIFQLQYALDTFYFLVCGALVMWMAAGFAMLEAGLVRSKNTVEILTKNVTLFAVACIMYMVVGYSIMYGGDIFLSTITGSGAVEGGEENATYAPSADFFFQVVFVATAPDASGPDHTCDWLPLRRSRPWTPSGSALTASASALVSVARVCALMLVTDVAPAHVTSPEQRSSSPRCSPATHLISSSQS